MSQIRTVLIMSTDASPVDTIPFEDVCLMLEKLYNRKNRKLEQNNILIDFIQDVKLRISKIKNKKVCNSKRTLIILVVNSIGKCS